MSAHCPTYTHIIENADQLFLKHTKSRQDGSEYTDYDFSIDVGDSRSNDVLKDNLDAAERLFRGMFSATDAQPSKEEFSQYAKAYLQAKKEVLEREISMAARNYRLNGDQLGDEHVRQLAEEVKAKNAELAQIRRALMNDKNLQRYIDSYVYGFDDALGSNQSQKFKALVDAGLDPSLAWSSAKGTANAKAQTTVANETLSDDEATAKEIQETQSAARTSREEVGMPMDVAPWAVTDGQGADESTPAGVGIALWRKYGLYTYPQTLESDAANEEYRKAYNMIVKSYLGGAYGETGTRAAAEKLETALRKARSKAKVRYSSEEETDEGGDLNGQK